MKHNKAIGLDEISFDLIKSLDDLGVEKLTNILNKIYDTGDLPEDTCKSIFIALPKKPRATDCELHPSEKNHIESI